MRRSPGSFRNILRRTSRRTVSLQTPSADAASLMSTVWHSGSVVVVFIINCQRVDRIRPKTTGLVYLLHKWTRANKAGNSTTRGDTGQAATSTPPGQEAAGRPTSGDLVSRRLCCVGQKNREEVILRPVPSRIITHDQTSAAAIGI